MYGEVISKALSKIQTRPLKLSSLSSKVFLYYAIIILILIKREKLVKIQETEWGYIEWLHHQEKNSQYSMNIGRTVILPGKHQIPHIHYGQEQMLYVLSGEGTYIINGESKDCVPGAIFYIEAGSTHETINNGTTPICELLVSNPISSTKQITIDKIKGMASSQENTLYYAVESLKSEFIDPLHLPFTILDTEGNTILQTLWYPEHCIHHCDPIQNQKHCDCTKPLIFDNYNQDEELTCPFGLRIFRIPIVHKNLCIGSLSGGCILVSENGSKSLHKGLYDTPESTASSIKNLLFELANNIVNYCVFDDARKELSVKENAIKISEKYGNELKQSLQIAQNNVTNLKINHHFLFNTLNCMASMALMDGSERLYHGIIDLANLFRYTMKTETYFVPFEKELSYLNNYLNLQKLRYRKNLAIDYDFTDELLGLAVPFNFLQPIVENAFIHGFEKNNTIKQIKLLIEKKENRIIIAIINNGTIIDPITLNRINRSLSNHSGHGLSLIYTKLTEVFNENFTMTIFSETHKTSVIINIPVLPFKGKEGVFHD